MPIPIEKEINHFPASNTDWQAGFGLTHNPDIDSIWKKPVSFYFNNSKCDDRAKDFYYGKYRPFDEPETQRLLDLVLTDDDSLRPFYRWILDKTIQIQDGALGEYTGVPARQYAEKFPREFFEYMDIDPSREKYINWTEAISYSGFFDLEDFENQESLRKQLMGEMQKNCTDCNASQMERINQFANDCFPDY